MKKKEIPQRGKQRGRGERVTKIKRYYKPKNERQNI
jgi:hypothetical protein